MLLRELQHAVRNLGRARRFSLACVFTLALALAGTATLLNLLEAFVFRQLAVSAPNELIAIYPARGEASAGFSLPALHALSARQQVLAGICGVTQGYGAFTVQFGSGAVRQRPAEAVTGNCYQLLGVTTSLGRAITTEDAPVAGDATHVVLVSDRVWREELGSSPDVLGQIVRVEGTPLTIIGVLPPTYRGLNADEAPDIALPLTLSWKLRRDPPLAMHAVGRLRPRTDIGEAAAHLNAIWPEVFRSTESANTLPQATENLRVVPLAHGFSVLRERYRRPLYALAALAGCLLLLGCVNIGGLSLARLLDRRKAFAVQLALGAGRLRLAVQLLAEGIVIGAAATLLAVPVAWWGSQVAGLSLWTGIRPFTIEATPLATTLLFTAFIGLVAGLLVSAPGLVALSVHNWELTARNVGDGGRNRGRRELIAVQIALCFVLAFGAALFTGNLYSLRQLPLGYDAAHLQWVRLDRTSGTAVAPIDSYANTLLSRIGALPGVESAAMSTSFGTTSLHVADPITVRTDASDVNSAGALTGLISPGFFRTTSIPLQQGRDFTWSDVSNRAGVVIVNRALADRLFPNGDALGRSIRIGTRERVVSVVGVAADATPGDPRIRDMPQLYLPLSPEASAAPALLLRVRSASVAEASLRDVIEPLGRHQMARVSSMNEQVERFLVQERLITSTSLLFAVLALVVGIAGLYAAMSQNVIRRTREIGIRIAVGATPNTVRALVFTEACWIVLIGVSLGIPGALAGGHAARSLLSDVSPNTMIVLAITGSMIAMVAAFVTALPAQRAARTPVATALRSE